MKIKKTPSKKLTPPPKRLRDLIKQLTDCNESDIPTYTASLPEWSFPRGDLFLWIPVLNRFDSILERICTEYNLDKIQERSFENETKVIIISIVHFTRLLIESCTNRNIYNSYEHLNKLLNTIDLDVLEAVLRLILRPAQRMSSQRNIRSGFSLSHDKITELARGWHFSKPLGNLDLLSLCDDDLQVTPDMATVRLQFFRTADTKKKDSKLLESPTSNTEEQSNEEGVIVITAQMSKDSTTSETDEFIRLVEEHAIPPEYHFELAHRIRITKRLYQPDLRKRLLAIRLLSIAIMSHTVSEAMAQNRVFMYEPSLISNLADLIHPEKNAPLTVQAAALYALDAIGRHRSKLSEVLTAVNASANHGTLLYILRKVTVAMDSEDAHYPQDFLDALFAFVTYLIQTQSGGQMLMSAGIIPTLLTILGNKKAIQLKNVTKSVGLLDSIVYGFAASFSAFCNAGGLDSLVNRIKIEVDYCTELAISRKKDAMEDVQDQSNEENCTPEEASIDEINNAAAPHERTALLKAMFKFVLHMMESSGTADGLRNLIDSTLPLSLKSVVEQPQVFGNSVFALAINVMSTFIHNEPTSLPILQEAKLPQSFLSTITEYTTVSTDVLLAASNAFGAICLNAPGLEMFNAAKPIHHFFNLFTSPQFLRANGEVDVATLLGTAMDELMRHHPVLKPDIIQAVIDMAKRVIEMGHQEIGKPADDSHLLRAAKPGETESKADALETSESTDIAKDTADTKTTDSVSDDKDKKDCILVSFIDVVARFLEGLFQNNAHCRDFTSEGGLEILLDIYSLPMLPGDFAVSIASDSLSYLFRLISEVNSATTIKIILKRLRVALENASDFLDNDSPKGMIVDFIDLKETEPEEIDRANKMFRKLVELHGFSTLLSNICTSPVFSHGKNGVAIVQEFVSQSEEPNILLLLGKLHRSAAFENFLLRSAVPKAWYSLKNLQKKASATANDHPLGISGFGLSNTDLTSESTSTTTDGKQPVTETGNRRMEPTEVRLHNTNQFRNVLTDMCACLMPIFQGLTKMSVTRRLMDNDQKKEAFRLAELMSTVIKENITFQRIYKASESCRYSYIASMTTMTSLLLMDDRSQPVLQTVLVVTFDRQKGPQCFFDTLKMLWEEAIKLVEIPESERNEDQKDKQKELERGIETILNIMSQLGSSKYLHDSPYTGSIASKEKDRTSANYFNPHEWLISMRLQLLPILRELWNTPNMKKFPKGVVRDIIKNMVQLIKGDGESDIQSTSLSIGPSTSNVRLTSSIFAPPRSTPVADETHVQTLIDMGFERASAEQALIRCNNQISRAIDYLFSHPQPFLSNNANTITSNRRTGDNAEGTNSQSALSEGEGDNQDNDEHEDDDDDHDDVDDSDDDDDEEIDGAEILQRALRMSMETPERNSDLDTDEDDDGPFRSEDEQDDEDKQAAAQKLKDEQEALVEQLAVQRKQLRDEISANIISLLDSREDIIFEIKDLCLVVHKFSGSDGIVNELAKYVEENQDLASEQSDSNDRMRSTLRLLALLFRENTMHTTLDSLAPKLIPILLKMFDTVSNLDINESLPSWHAALCLVLEVLVASQEEPRSVPLETERQAALKKEIEAGKTLKEAEAIVPRDIEVEMNTDDSATLDAQRVTMLSACVKLLHRPNPTKDDLHAILRILVRVTRNHEMASSFVQQNGLQLLMELPRHGLNGFRGQQAFIIIILRNIIEDLDVIEETMKDLITTWFTIPRPRLVDIATFVRTNGHVALREPNTFIKVVERVCRLTKYDPTGRSQQIGLAPKPDSKESTEVRKDASGDVEMGPSESNEADLAQASTMAHDRKAKCAELVVNHLVTELMNVRPQMSEPVKLDEEETEENKEELEKKRISIVNGRYVYAGFLLQCLVELVSSYPSCKYYVIKHQLRRGSKDSSASSSSKGRDHGFVNMLLNDFLPYGQLNPTEDSSRLKYSLSTWTASVLVAMCYDNSNQSEGQEPQKSDLLVVRKSVLDAILRSFKEAISTTDAISVQYGKYLAYADLCHRILNASPNSGGPLQKPKEDTPINIAKIMLDKGFVAVLTNAVSDVDVNYPHAKTVLNALLRPLEQLTKIAIKIERTDEPAKGDKKAAGDDHHAEFVAVPDSAHDEEDEAPDLYRNSALGMYDGSVMEEEEEDEMESDEDEDGFDEDEFDQEPDSDLSEMSDLSDDDDDDEEGIEEEDMMHHHHYHSGMEDDEDDMDEDDDAEMISDDEGEEIIDDDEDVDESDDDDEGGNREMTWHLEDITDQNEPIIRLHTEIDDDDHEHHHHRRHGDPFDDDQDDDLNTLDTSDFDEDDESENVEDDDIEAEITEDVFDDDILENPFLVPHELDDGIAGTETDGWARASRSIGSHRRHARGLHSIARRGGWETTMPPIQLEAVTGRGVDRTPLFDMGSVQVVGRSFRDHPGGGSGGNNDEIVTHPLLANRPGGSSGDSDTQRGRRSHGFSNLQAFEDILGGSAVQVLENLLNNRVGGGSGGAYRVDVYNNGTGQVTSSFELDRMPGSSGPSSGNQRGQHSAQETEAWSALQDFQPLNSSERWLQEGRMLYGSSLTDKAGKLFNAVSNVLVPHAIEDDKRKRVAEEEARAEQRRKEEEERRQAEEERLRKEEEERKLKAEEAKAAAEASAHGEVSSVEESADQSSATPEQEEPTQSATTIMINGEEVDISGTGIDIEFLEALPDDLRHEVVNQHIQERQPPAPSTETESISPEFLNALPPEIREEVLQQEAIERERRERQRQQGITSTQASTAGTRSTNLLTPLDAFANEFEALLNSGSSGGDSSAFQTRLIRRSPGRLPHSPTPATSQSKVNHRKDVIQLVDRAQLATLVRLLFVPQAISKGLLNKLLLNLCENSKSRGDLLSLLICILQDGSADLAAVDRSFAQLSLQSKTSTKIQKAKASSSSATAVAGESVPNLVTQRCLEALIYIVSCNSHTLTYFLTENDHLSTMKKANIKKAKGKEKDKHALSKYPMVVLMSLLDRPVFTSNSGLMEQLMHFLATICRPLPALVKKTEEKEESKAKQQVSTTEEQNKDKNTAITNDDSQPTETEESSKAEGHGSSHKYLPKPPVIPEMYIKMIVHVLTTGECSSRTFQYTLNVISHLSALDGAQQVITKELVADASQSGAQIRKDLKELHTVMENTMSGVDIQGTTLAKFSPASSQQAKLLRVLKTIDYMYSRKQGSDSKSKDKDAADLAQKNEERILKIFDELEFGPMWRLLGSCLAVVHEKEEMINVATVLLPLIEAFMVVSKYVAEKGSQKALATAATTPSVEIPIPDAFEEEFFFRFTEEHKKILNIMVRNNPSLMSGSFSLLVKNPKMLEFDNKRNYFNQQLHKRTNRDHYPSLQLNVRRQYVFEDSYHQLQGRNGDEIKYGKLTVRFYDEEGVDAGGVSREWFSVLARQMFDPNYALFKTSAADKLTYQPNRASWANPDHLSFFTFVGRVIGKAIYDGRLLDAYFTRSFYKHILGRQVDYRDVEAIDPEYYKSLVWMLENDITDIIDLTFSVDTDDFGNTKTIDLKPNGRDIPVTEENKQEYVKLITEQKLTVAIKDQINAFLDGFHDIISAQLISIFNEQELELLISGMPDIDIDDWKNNTEYQGYSQSSPQINWFWRAVRSFDQEERAKLLQFATGTSKVPLEGFAHLQGSGGTQKFQIHCQYSANRLPSAHTCFNQVDLPQYESYEALRANLLTAIRECSTGFGFG
ncbi:hypothetical protein BGW37DRAFT_459292 [Umbelopsis sp. PMI_123]|nr:hypothetical protein BGW37DRAFT_459292 [Umbelopsis sp. PMI_123]